MAENVDGGGLRRKKRRIGQKDHGKGDQEAQEAQEAPQNFQRSAAPAYDFLHLASFILEWDIPILFPGSARPRNSYAMIGSGGSFLVFNEVRTMDDVIIKPEEVRSLADKMVLKRTRAHQLHPEAGASNDSIRYSSIMAELQVLTNRSIAEHENFIDLLGLTWDFEPDSDGINSVWPVLALEAAECSMETHMYNLRDAPLSQKIKYCRDVATALEFLHERGVVHCDIKLENVLICVTPSSGSVAKLSDFGSALLDITPDTKLPYGVVGTRPWNAPEYGECLQGLDIFKLDVFSYGMLLWRSISHSRILEELSRSQGAERESILNSLEEKKKSNQLVQVAIQDLKTTCGQSSELSAVIGLLESTFSSHPKERLTMAEVKTSLDGMAVQLSDDGDEAENEAGSPHEELDDPVGSPGISEYTDESLLEELQTDDVRILPAPMVPLYNDVSTGQVGVKNIC
jgi:Protein kinase domain